MSHRIHGSILSILAFAHNEYGQVDANWPNTIQDQVLSIIDPINFYITQSQLISQSVLFWGPKLYHNCEERDQIFNFQGECTCQLPLN